ncbi:integrase [Streptomyces sp. NPDC057486]|uniref:integrase n=1 Tax=Streptomyces sp. NPDC057486 TaxID=3346145 RepID=UPI0036C931EC
MPFGIASPGVRRFGSHCMSGVSREGGRSGGVRPCGGAPSRFWLDASASAGIDPVPRLTGPTWTEFLTNQAEGVIAVDFFHLDAVLGRRLYAPTFLKHSTRRLRIAGVTVHPTHDWAVQQARNLATDPGTRMESLRFLLRDRDSTYGQFFDAVFEAEEIEILKSAPRAPRMNAHWERVIGTIRREALDRVLIMNEAHARHVGPASSAASSTSTDTPPDPQRRLSEPTGCFPAARVRVRGLSRRVGYFRMVARFWPALMW